MTDRPETGQFGQRSLAEMLPTLKEYPDLQTATVFPSVGLQMLLSYADDDRYLLLVCRIDRPTCVLRSEVLSEMGIGLRFHAMKLLADMAAERMSAATIEEAESILMEASGE